MAALELQLNKQIDFWYQAKPRGVEFEVDSILIGKCYRTHHAAERNENDTVNSSDGHDARNYGKSQARVDPRRVYKALRTTRVYNARSPHKHHVVPFQSERSRNSSGSKQRGRGYGNNLF